MTCIVGLVYEDKVYIGGDSAGVSGWDLTHRKDTKVFKNGDMLFGFTSSFRMGQLLRFSFTIPKQPSDMDDYEYMCTDFISAVIKVFKEHGYAKVDSNEVTGGSFLVGYKGRIYKVDSDFQVGESLDGFDACGCGESYALGAIRALKLSGEDQPVRSITYALETAEHFSAGVRGPFNIEVV